MRTPIAPPQVTRTAASVTPGVVGRWSRLRRSAADRRSRLDLDARPTTPQSIARPGSARPPEKPTWATMRRAQAPAQRVHATAAPRPERKGSGRQAGADRGPAGEGPDRGEVGLAVEQARGPEAGVDRGLDPAQRLVGLAGPGPRA